MNLKYKRHKGRRGGREVEENKEDTQVGSIDRKERKTSLLLTAPSRVSFPIIHSGPDHIFIATNQIMGADDPIVQLLKTNGPL